jgi:hypothetical protein
VSRGLRWLSDAALAASLLAIGRVLLGSFHDYATSHDLDFYDDSSYQNIGEKPGRHAAEWAPLYRLWARCLHLLTHDSVLTFHLNAYVLVLGVPLLLFVVARAYQVAPLMAFTSALAWLLSASNVDVGPRVASFALLPMLGWLLVARGITADAWRWSWLCAGALFCSFVRPEFFYALLLMLAFGVWRARADALPRSWLLPLALPVLVVVILAVIGEVPLGGSRATMAIRQHLLLNAMSWQGIPAEQWQGSGALLAAYPSLDKGLLNFVLNDPGTFTRHLLTNAGLLLSSRLTDGVRPADFLAQSALWPALVAICLPLLLLLRAPSIEAPLGGPRRDAILALLAYTAPSVLLCFVIYPRPHYLILPQLALLLVAIIAITPRAGGRRAALAVAGAALGLVSMSAVAGWYIRPVDPTPMQNTVHHLRGLTLPPRYGILDDAGVLHFHLPASGASYQRHQVRPPLGEWLADRPVELIVMRAVDGKPIRSVDRTWAELAAEPARHGYRCEFFRPGSRILCQRVRPAAASADAESTRASAAQP